MIVKVTKELGKKMEVQIKKIHEKLNKNLDKLKSKQMNKIITEMKNALEGINNRTND